MCRAAAGRLDASVTSTVPVRSSVCVVSSRVVSRAALSSKLGSARAGSAAALNTTVRLLRTARCCSAACCPAPSCIERAAERGSGHWPALSCSECCGQAGQAVCDQASSCASEPSWLHSLLALFPFRRSCICIYSTQCTVQASRYLPTSCVYTYSRRLACTRSAHIVSSRSLTSEYTAFIPRFRRVIARPTPVCAALAASTRSHTPQRGQQRGRARDSSA